jgi:hypothetical protein
LGTLGRFPDLGVFELAAYLDEALMLAVVVKDTPAAP